MSNDSTTAPSTQTYVLALEDDFDPSYNTIHTFTDPAIWEWLNEKVTFPIGQNTMHVAIPGTNDWTWITAGSYSNDKAQSLPNTGDSREDSVHPNLTAVDFDDDYDATLTRLSEEVGAGNVYSGLWY